VAATMLAAGARVNDRSNEGMTPLMLAASRSRNPDVLTVLLRAGADVSLRSNEDKTARDYAVDNAALEGTQALKDLDLAGPRRRPAVPSTGWWDR
jgi:ankyrin repeat protein